MSRIQEEIAALQAELLDNIARWRDAKWRFSEVTRIYRARPKFEGDTHTADLAAAGDYRRRVAVADCEWHQREINTIALAILALRGEP